MTAAAKNHNSPHLWINRTDRKAAGGAPCSASGTKGMYIVEKTPPPKLMKLFALMVPATMIWGANFVVIKGAIPYFPPFTLAFVRFLLATISLLPFIQKDRRINPVKVRKRDIWLMALAGVTGISMYHICFNIAMKTVGSTTASLIVASVPIIVTLLAAVLLHERLRFWQVAALLMALTGVSMATLFGGAGGTFSFGIGEMLLLMTVVTQSINTLVTRRLLHVYSPILVLSVTFASGMALLLPFALLESPWQAFATAPLSGWLCLLYSSFLSSTVSYLLHQMALKEFSVARSSIFMNMTPLFSALFASIFLQEEIGLWTALGGVLILGGVVWNSRIRDVAAPLPVPEADTTDASPQTARKEEAAHPGP